MTHSLNQNGKVSIIKGLASAFALSSLISLSMTAYAAPLSVQPVIASAHGFHVSSTIVKGQKEMILIDGQFLQSDAHRLVATMLETGLALKSILITHAHPDHYFGLDVVLETFPGTPVYAAAEVVKEMAIMSPKKMAQWKPVFGHNLTDKPVTATALTTDVTLLEGEKIQLIHIGQGDTHNSSVFYIPSAKTLVAGDLTYKDIHPWTAETNNHSREEWAHSLKQIKKLGAENIISGHMLPNSNTEAMDVLSFNQEYLQQFNHAVNTSKNADDLKSYIFEKFPALQLPIIAEIGAKVAKPK